jgi:hypothetical protein
MNEITDFRIIANKPKNNAAHDSGDTKLADAIYTIYPLETEDAVLFWGDERIALSYRYDIGTIIDDLLEMVFALCGNSTGEWSVAWPSNSFASNWHFRWSENVLRITAEWREEFEASDYLINNNLLVIEKGLFLGEWKSITDRLLIDLFDCGYTCDSILDMKLLIEANRIISAAEGDNNGAERDGTFLRT